MKSSITLDELKHITSMVWYYTGMDLNKNKALRYYVNYGIQSTLKRVLESLDDNLPLNPTERLAFALLITNRRMNGSTLPGIPYEVDAIASHRFDLFLTSPEVQAKGLASTRPSTLKRWVRAVEILDVTLKSSQRA